MKPEVSTSLADKTLSLFEREPYDHFSIPQMLEGKAPIGPIFQGVSPEELHKVLDKLTAEGKIYYHGKTVIGERWGHISYRGKLEQPLKGFIASPEFSRFNTQYSTKQLQSMAKDHNISSAGLKEDLIRRLVEKGILK